MSLVSSLVTNDDSTSLYSSAGGPGSLSAIPSSPSSGSSIASGITSNSRGSRNSSSSSGKADSRLIIWSNMTASTTEVIWRSFSTYLSPTLLDGIITIKRVSRPNTHVFYDVLVKSDLFDDIFKECRLLAKRLGWYVKRHIPYHQRHAKQRNQDSNGSMDAIDLQIAGPLNNSLVVVSLNVRGIRMKRDEVLYLCRSKKVDVLLLQETLLQDNGWRFHLPGYFVVYNTVNASHVTGGGGVLVAVRNGLSVSEIRTGSPYSQWIRLLVNGSQLIFGSVYIPPEGNAGGAGVRKEAKFQVQLEATQLLRKYPLATMVIGGDWNMKPKTLLAYWSKSSLSLQPLSFSGSERTMRKHTSCIDNFVTLTRFGVTNSNAQVLRNWDLSDHWPIKMRLNLPTSVPRDDNGWFVPKRALNIRSSVILADDGKRQQLVMHNRFEALATDILSQEPATSNDALNAQVNTFISEAKAVLEDCDLLVKAKQQPQKQHQWQGLSSKAKKLIDKRRHLGKQLSSSSFTDNITNTEHQKLQSQYDDLFIRSKAQVALDRKAAWLRYVESGIEHLNNNNMKGFWRWVKATAGTNKTSSVGASPVVNRNNVLCETPDEILKAWADHYQSLTLDITGHSRDDDYWRDLLESLPYKSELPLLNEDVLWAEVNEILRQLVTGKAPGATGLSPEFFKAAYESDPKDVPSTPLGKLILYFTKQMFELGLVAEVMKTALVVSIPKKDGDLTNMDDYRGISLIDCLYKVVCTLAARRISYSAELVGLFSDSQAGFRKGEECPGQVVSLFEVCQRRLKFGKKTYVAFIDIRKAFDTVPHGALLEKLRKYGIRGRMLAFLRSLYGNSKLRVWQPCGLSDEVTMERGVRQGCPLSAVLFVLFINDILDGMTHLGATVFGFPDGVNRCPGFLFADDLALTAGRLSHLKRMLRKLEDWGVKYEMQFGIKKCGVMVVTSPSGQPMATNNLRVQHLKLQGTLLPVIEKYVYLGVEFNCRLDITAIIGARVEKTRKALMALRGPLTNKLIPLQARNLILKQCILPIASYGAELFGMLQVPIKPLQRIFAGGMRWVLGLTWGNRRTCLAVMCAELGIPPLYAHFAAYRARLYIKIPSMRTFVRLILLFPLKGGIVRQGRPWSQSTRIWLQRYCPSVLDLHPSKSKLAGQMVRDELTNYVWRDGSSLLNRTQSAFRYKTHSFFETCDYVRLASQFPDLAIGVMTLAQMRCNAFWTASALNSIGFIVGDWKNKCPCCELPIIGGETYKHILVQCAKWRDERSEMLCVLERIIGQEAYSVLSAEKKMVLLLGGGVGDELIDAKVKRAFLQTNKSQAKAARRRSFPLFWYVAEFLSNINAERRAIIWAYGSKNIPLRVNAEEV